MKVKPPFCCAWHSNNFVSARSCAAYAEIETEAWFCTGFLGNSVCAILWKLLRNYGHFLTLLDSVIRLCVCELNHFHQLLTKAVPLWRRAATIRVSWYCHWTPVSLRKRATIGQRSSACYVHSACSGLVTASATAENIGIFGSPATGLATQGIGSSAAHSNCCCCCCWYWQDAAANVSAVT